MPRIHLPVLTDRSPISSKTGSGASVISAPRFLVSVRQASVGPAVDHHRAAAADAGAADEVELQRRVLLLADLVQRDEQRHAVGFLELVGLHVRHAAGLLRVVAQHADLQLRRGVAAVAAVRRLRAGTILMAASLIGRLSAGSSSGSSMRSLRPRSARAAASS